MTGLMKRIFRRREPGQPPRRGVSRLFRGRRARGRRLPGYRRIPSFRLPGMLRRWPPWKPAPAPDPGDPAAQVVAEGPPPSFQDRGRLRRRLRFLRRARELGFRDIGGLIFDMRRFERSRPDLLDAKLDALLAVDQELRALERILDDQRSFHELREPGISSCARCGALHSSEANFCPQCGLQFSGPRAMGEVGGAIAAPPQAPAAPGAGQAPARRQQEWPWPAHEPPADQPTAPTAPVQAAEPVTEQLTVPYVPVLKSDAPAAETPEEVDDEAETEAQNGPAATEPAADEATSKGPAPKPSRRKSAAEGAAAKKPATPADPAPAADPHKDDIAPDEQQTEPHLPPPQASGGS